jgi:hypothetical protein
MRESVAGSSRGHGRLAEKADVLAPFFVGFLLAVFGTYWDDAWHTVKGRDEFLSPPHLALYAGIALAGAAFGLWALLVVRAEGVRGALRRPSLALGVVGVGVALAGGPIDNAWHEAFGRDAVLWSPPHMLGVAGTFAIAAAVLLEMRQSSGRMAGAARTLAGAALLGAAAVSVLEYDTDVPQFDEVFYLPVLATASALALGLIIAADQRRWAATRAAALYTLVLGAVALALSLGGLPAPVLPLLVIPAAGLDVAARRGWARPLAALAYVAALFAVYAPYLNLVAWGVRVDLADVLLGLPLAAAGGAGGLLLAPAKTGARPGSRAVVATAVAVCLLIAPAAALGHDPGQGRALGTAEVRGLVEDRRGSLHVRLLGHCADAAPVRTVGRRAGAVVAGPLVRDGRCSFGGRVTLTAPGRWFVYGEFRHAGARAETWVPLTAGEDGDAIAEARSFYVPPAVQSPATKILAGITLYVLVAVVLVATAALYRRQLRSAHRPAT